MKHAAEILPANEYHRAIYAEESTTPTGTYHWAKPKGDKPPTLRKITRVHYETLVRYFDGDQLQFGYRVTIWKHGWHHIKGARKKARK